jgi:hypothetical protein
MLEEEHTISYIQQASHEWIMGDEEEIVYAQAIESLRVVPIDIQHGPEVFIEVQSSPQAFGQSFV